MQEIQVTVSMKFSNMYDFLLRYNYKGLAGLMGPAFSVLAFVALCVSHSALTRGQIVLLIIASLLFTVINPLLIMLKAAKQIKLNPTFKDPIIYTLNKQKITVMQNEEILTKQWKDVQEVVETRSNIILYLTKVHAFVLPKEAIGENLPQVREMIRSCANKAKLKLAREKVEEVNEEK